MKDLKPDPFGLLAKGFSGKRLFKGARMFADGSRRPVLGECAPDPFLSAPELVIELVHDMISVAEKERSGLVAPGTSR